jgi:hypothetical protein
MRQRTWFWVIAAAAGAACVYASFWTWLYLDGVYPAGDYPGPACNGCDSAGPPIAALVHGNLSAFFSRQPFMGSVSLLLRAPFVAVAKLARGDIVVQYQVGTLVCLLAALIVLAPGVWAMLRRGRRPLIALIAILAIVLGPATSRAVFWGHPEEILGAALAVAAVLAAIRRNGVAAGVFLGLAVATKQWGVFGVLPVLIVARGQRRQVASVALVVAGAFIVPMIAGDPGRFFEQNFHTASAQLGETPTNVWWVFHQPGFDPSIHRDINVIPNMLRELSHPLAVAIVIGLSVLYWRRGAEKDQYDALALLALVFLVRCMLDPLAASYHHTPFVVSLAMFEGLRRRGLPVITLISTAAILVMTHFVRLDQPGLLNAVYLVWALPTAGYLTVFALRHQPENTTALKPVVTPLAANLG